MRIARHVIVFDSADLAAESGFWARLLGGTVDDTDPDGDWHKVDVDGETRLAVQLAPDHVRPEWPSGNPQQIHLDLYVDDIVASHDEVIAMGATLLRAAGDLSAARGFQVYADPAGHPFCLCWPAG